MNIVKLRYADMPLFVEVASVVSGYSLESAVNLNGTLRSNSSLFGDNLSLGASGRFTDRPTITYAPITGAKFNKSFLQPLPPKAILFLLQSGWAVDMVLPITVSALNGHRSRIAGGRSKRSGDPEFYRAIYLLRKLQKSGAVEMRILEDGNQEEVPILFFYRKNSPQEVIDAIEEFNLLLGLNPLNDELEVTYGFLPKTDHELAMVTRSMLQLMIEIATQIEVPPEHIEQKRTIPTEIEPDSEEKKIGYLTYIHSSIDRPEDAFVKIKFKDHWFWIDDRDFLSKRTFTFLMTIFSLTETGGKEGLPLVTIPAG